MCSNYSWAVRAGTDGACIPEESNQHCVRYSFTSGLVYLVPGPSVVSDGSVEHAVGCASVRSRSRSAEWRVKLATQSLALAAVRAAIRVSIRVKMYVQVCAFALLCR